MTHHINITKYEAYFHDGNVLAVKQNNNNIELSMESAPIPPYEIKDHLNLSNFSALKGKLHLENVKGIKKGGVPIQLFDNEGYDAGKILDLCIKSNTVELLVTWEDYYPYRHEDTDTGLYVIEAENIYWENLPDLADPFMKPIEDYAEPLWGGHIFHIRYDNERCEDRIEISMESLPITPAQNTPNFTLSERGTLRGLLLLDWIKSVRKNKSPFAKRKLKKVFDEGEILDFTIGKHIVLLNVKWKTLPPKEPKKKVELIEIKASAIFWRNEPTPADVSNTSS